MSLYLFKFMSLLISFRHRQNELGEGAQRAVPKQYCYIDYQHFRDVVKWRIADIYRIIDGGLRNVRLRAVELLVGSFFLQKLNTKTTQCSKAFAPLEVDFNLGVLSCGSCQAELVENKTSQGTQDGTQRFYFQMRFILDCLRKTEDMILPA